jgi:hypothetical protein
MFNERASHIQQRIVAGTGRFCSAQFCDPVPQEMMMGAIIAFGIAVGVAALICHQLLTRFRNAVSSTDPLLIAPDRPAAMTLVTAEAISPGSQARIQYPAIRVLRVPPTQEATLGEAMAAEAPTQAAVAMQAAEATEEGAEATNNPPKRPAFRAAQATTSILDSFQSVSGISLELLEKTVFPFASRSTLEYLKDFASHTGPLF